MKLCSLLLGCSHFASLLLLPVFKLFNRPNSITGTMKHILLEQILVLWAFFLFFFYIDHLYRKQYFPVLVASLLCTAEYALQMKVKCDT